MKRLVTFDWAAKKLLRSKANFGILEGFLSELLYEDIKIKQLLESESNKEKKEGKFNRVDLLVENSKGELIIIEVQNQRENDYFQRMLYGTSKLIIDFLPEGYKYSQIKKII
jgi:predicted transposase/invertase (TIGR01784 family)